MASKYERSEFSQPVKRHMQASYKQANKNLVIKWFFLEIKTMTIYSKVVLHSFDHKFAVQERNHYDFS